MPPNPKISIGIINLKSAVSRRENLQAQFSNLGIDCYFFDAYYPNGMAQDEMARLTQLHKPFEHMTNGQFGCDLSHYYLQKDWYENHKSDYLLIIEDDAVLYENFADLIKNIGFLDDLDFDIVKFGGLNTKRDRLGIKIGQFMRFEIVYPFTYTNGTQAYLIKRQSYLRIEKVMREFFCPVDLRLFDLIPYDFKVLELSPFVILQTDEESTIGARKKPKRKKTIFTRISNEYKHVARQIMNISRGFKFYGKGLGFAKIKGEKTLSKNQIL